MMCSILHVEYSLTVAPDVRTDAYQQQQDRDEV